jgi:hypothetical protein
VLRASQLAIFVLIRTSSTDVTTAQDIFGRRTIWLRTPPREDDAMALEPLSAAELAKTPTLFASFMGYVDSSYKTVGQLLAIYRARSRSLAAGEDPADDLRVDRFMDDMASKRWTTHVVMRIGVFDDTLLVIDGIHRGIAYLACIEEGISPERLPVLCVDC